MITIIQGKEAMHLNKNKVGGYMRGFKVKQRERIMTQLV